MLSASQSVAFTAETTFRTFHSHRETRGGVANKPDIPRTQSATLPCHPQGGSTARQRTEQNELSSQCLLPTAPLLSESVAHAGTPLNETVQQQGGWWGGSCASARRHCETDIPRHGQCQGSQLSGAPLKIRPCPHMTFHADLFSSGGKKRGIKSKLSKFCFVSVV